MDKLGWFMSRHQHDAREDEPVGTADTSSFDYIRWQYVAETEKERPTQPSCIMLNMTRRGGHWRLYDSEI